MFNPKELKKERDRQRYHESLANAGRREHFDMGSDKRFSRFGVKFCSRIRAKLRKTPLLGRAMLTRQLVASRRTEESTVNEDEKYFADIDFGDELSQPDSIDDVYFYEQGEESHGDNERNAIVLEGDVEAVGKDVQEHYQRRTASQIQVHARVTTANSTKESCIKTKEESESAEVKKEEGGLLEEISASVKDVKTTMLESPRPSTTDVGKRSPSEKRVMATRLLELGRSRSAKNVLLKVGPDENYEISSTLKRISSRLSLRERTISPTAENVGNSVPRGLLKQRDTRDAGKQKQEQEIVSPTINVASLRSSNRRRGSLRRDRIGIGLEQGELGIEETWTGLEEW